MLVAVLALRFASPANALTKTTILKIKRMFYEYSAAG